MAERNDTGMQSNDYGIKQSNVDPELRKMFLNTFSGERGEEVLIHILNLCDYFTVSHQINPDKFMIAQQIMYIMGVTDETNIKRFINSALNTSKKANLKNTNEE